MFQEWYVMLYILSSSYRVGNRAQRKVRKRVVACEQYSIHMFTVLKISWYFGIDKIFKIAGEQFDYEFFVWMISAFVEKNMYSICRWRDGDYVNLSGYTKRPCYVTRPCWTCNCHLHIYTINADGKSLIYDCDGCVCIVFTTLVSWCPFLERYNSGRWGIFINMYIFNLFLNSHS